MHGHSGAEFGFPITVVMPIAVGANLRHARGGAVAISAILIVDTVVAFNAHIAAYAMLALVGEGGTRAEF
jgi:hypothetical protein